jgi:hypothetical protein
VQHVALDEAAREEVAREHLVAALADAPGESAAASGSRRASASGR